MRARRVVVAAGVLLAAVPACSGPADRSPAASTEEPAPAGDAELVVRREQPEGPIAVEGSAAFARLESGGDVLFDEPFDLPSEQGPLSRSVAPGEYTLFVYQRACDPSACSEIGPAGWGPPVARCRSDVTVPAGDRVEVVVTVTSDGCTISTDD